MWSIKIVSSARSEHVVNWSSLVSDCSYDCLSEYLPVGLCNNL